MHFADQVCDPEFSQRVKQESKVNLDRCYQCLTCSLGCPVAFAMDYYPHQIIRMVQLGLKQQTLTSSTLWLCSSCETCVTRCPNEVDLPRMMNTLREIALKEGIKGKEPQVLVFHRTFLDSVKRFGKQHELSMLLFLKWRTRDIFSDVGLGMKMLVKGKLKLLPPKSKSTKEVKLIFEKVERGASH